MRNSIIRLAVFALTLFGCDMIRAQAAATPVTTADNGSFQPAYYVGSGASYDYYGGSGVVPSLHLGVRVGSTNVYSWTSLELGTLTSSIRTGAAYLFNQSGNWSLLALGDAGLAQTATAALGSFSAGGIALYDIGARVTKGSTHAYIGGGVLMMSIASKGMQPVGVFTIGKGF